MDRWTDIDMSRKCCWQGTGFGKVENYLEVLAASIHSPQISFCYCLMLLIVMTAPRLDRLYYSRFISA